MINISNTWSKTETLTESELVKIFTFTSVHQMLKFLERVQSGSNAIEHSPNTRVSSELLRIHITLTTHDSKNKVTELDLLMARIIDRAYTLSIK